MKERDVAGWLLALLGAGALANGVVMLAAPEPWFERIAADTGPFNVHLVRDVGAAYATSGVAALWAARSLAWRAPLALAAALFQALHGAIHGLDVALGLQPASHLLEDLPGVYLPTLALAVVALRSLRTPTRA